MKTMNCPEDCRYYHRNTHFCGYCMRSILEDMEVRKLGNREEETADIEQAGGVWHRYREESHGA
jgi:hypothetical protein